MLTLSLTPAELESIGRTARNAARWHAEYWHRRNLAERAAHLIRPHVYGMHTKRAERIRRVLNGRYGFAI